MSSGTTGGRVSALHHGDWSVRIGIALALAIAAHFALSRFGFNPTDDGFILAQSRRLLDGQLPHRDFISIRPVGSALFHVMDLLIGGDRAFWVSRLFYWLEVALGCWCWLEITLRAAGQRIGWIVSAPLLALAVMFSTHAFPPMAWHTVDAVFLASLGFLLLQGQGARIRMTGYFLIGLTAICKQNFLPLLPLAVLVSGDLRRPPCWLAVSAPMALYSSVVAAWGGGRDLVQQISALTSLGGFGELWRVRGMAALLGLMGGIAIGGLHRAGARASLRNGPFGTAIFGAAFIAVWAGLVAIGGAIDEPGFRFIDRASFVLAGVAGGMMLARPRVEADPVPRAGMFLMVLAACSSVSIGYQTPAHVAGPLLLVVAVLAAMMLRRRSAAVEWRLSAVAGWVAMAAVLPHWWSARTGQIYNDRAAIVLTQPLDGVFPGARGILTNTDTHAVLQDLHDAIEALGPRRYAILVDAPGWWARAEQGNPLPADWPQSIELCTEELQVRYSQAILDQRGTTTFVVQKLMLNSLASGFVPLPSDNLYYGAAIWVRTNCVRKGESAYWEFYE